MKVLYDTPVGPIVHLYSPHAPTRLTWCGRWAKAESEPAHPALLSVDAHDVTYLSRLAPRARVCASCAENALRGVAADFERLRALKREGRTA